VGSTGCPDSRSAQKSNQYYLKILYEILKATEGYTYTKAISTDMLPKLKT
jgi:hypothetical protein